MDEVTAGSVDDKLRRRLVERFGSGALEWIAGLPTLLDKLADRWQLTFTGVRRSGRTSVVYGCKRADGRTGMLKVSPEPRLIKAEAGTLRVWRETSRVPQVWEADSQIGALLMESVEPGHTVGHFGQVPDLERVVDLIAGLHAVRVTERQLREWKPLSGWVNFFFEQWERRRAEGPGADVVSPALMHQARCQARILAAADDHVVPLHGDLHRDNVLDGGRERGLVAIDPRACAGDPAFDAVDWVVWRAESLSEVRRRVAVLAPGVGTTEERLLRVSAAIAPVLAVAGVTAGVAVPRETATLLELAETHL